MIAWIRRVLASIRQMDEDIWENQVMEHERRQYIDEMATKHQAWLNGERVAKERRAKIIEDYLKGPK